MAYHTFQTSGQIFEIETRYTPIRPIGHGSYGVVISAVDELTGEKVAIKKIPRAFEDPLHAKSMLREIKLMKAFSHDNVIRIKDIIPPPVTAEGFDDVYLVLDLMDTDLHRIIYSKQSLNIDHIQYFIYQILKGLNYIHSAHVLHRDLKPSNILLKTNCELKICDFGFARGVETDSQDADLTEYVVTRWYRAPEIMLACQEYTSAIDMWSVGCIFAELLARSPLFPGEDYITQIKLICQKLGKPTDDNLNFVTAEGARRFIDSLPNDPPPTFTEMFIDHQYEDLAFDLLKEMLIINPKKRITINQAFEHPFFESLHNPDDELCEQQVNCCSYHFDNEELSRKKIKDMIWEEIREYHHDLPQTYPTTSHRTQPNHEAFT